MNQAKVYKSEVFTPVRVDEKWGQAVFYFENKYGASVVSNEFSKGGQEGLFEVAILKKDEDDDYQIYKKTYLQNEKITAITSEEVSKLLFKINNLTSDERPNDEKPKENKKSITTKDLFLSMMGMDEASTYHSVLSLLAAQSENHEIRVHSGSAEQLTQLLNEGKSLLTRIDPETQDFVLYMGTKEDMKKDLKNLLDKIFFGKGI